MPLSSCSDSEITHASLTLSHGNFIGFQLALLIAGMQLKALMLPRQNAVNGLIILFTIISLLSGVFTLYLCIQTWIRSRNQRTIFGEAAYIALIILDLLVMIATVMNAEVLL
jgi:hypothetical protein